MIGDKTASREDKRELGYAPHFYGPYSSGVQRVTNDLRDVKLINEKVAVLPSWAPEQFDVHQYRYTLTDARREAGYSSSSAPRSRRSLDVAPQAQTGQP